MISWRIPFSSTGKVVLAERGDEVPLLVEHGGVEGARLTRTAYTIEIFRVTTKSVTVIPSRWVATARMTSCFDSWPKS